MAALKWTSMALMALLSLAICSGHRVFSSMPDAKTAGEPDPRVMDEINDPELVWEGGVGGGGSSGFVGSGGGYGHGSGSGGGGGGGGGWNGGETPGYGGTNPGAGGSSGSGGYGYGSGSGGGSNGGGGGGSGGYGAPEHGGSDGGGSDCGGGSGGNVPPKFEINPEYPYYCQATTCCNPDGCPGFTVYLGRHGLASGNTHHE